MGNTTKTLVEDLKKKIEAGIENKHKHNAVHILITLAEKGDFHDFATDRAMPKNELRNILLNLDYNDLAQKVVDGEYDDESPEDVI